MRPDGIFLPDSSPPGPNGSEVEFRFILEESGRDILAGRGTLVGVRDGANGENPAFGIRFEELSERSRRNLEMILAWAAEAET